MSAKYVQAGKTITYTNPSTTDTVAYGDVIDLDTRIAVAAESIAPSADGSAAVEGVYEIPAINTAEFAQGENLYWDPAGKLTNAGDGLTPAGFAFAKKASTAAVALVKIG